MSIPRHLLLINYTTYILLMCWSCAGLLLIPIKHSTINIINFKITNNYAMWECRENDTFNS